MNELPLSILIAFLTTVCVYIVGTMMIAKNEKIIKEKNIENKVSVFLLIVLGVTFLLVKSLVD